MPIVVSHQPDLGFLSQASYFAGLSEWKQQQARMAQQERMQMRGINANLYSQAMGQQNAMQRDAFGYQQQIALENMRQGNRMQMLEMDRNAQAQDFFAEMDEKRRAARLQMESMENRGVADFYFGQVDDTMKRIQDLLANGYEFEGDGLNQWQSLQQQLANIDKDGTLTPFQKAEAMYKKVLQEAPMPSMKRPAFQSEVDENTAWVTDPSTGQAVLVGRAREYSSLFTPDMKTEEEQQPQQKSLRSLVFSGTKEGQSQLSALYKIGQEALTAETSDGLDGTVKKVPSPEEVFAWIDKYIAQHDSRGGVEQGQQQGETSRPKWEPEAGFK